MHGLCNFDNNLSQLKTLKFQKHSPVVLLTSKTFCCHQYSTDFTHFVPITEELVFHSSKGAPFSK